MYLEVPIKLENYVQEIKKQTQYIDQETDRITLLQIGKSAKNDHVKLMYLMYNPFPITLNIDLNFFQDLSNLYKIYPANFSVAPGTCFAFVVYANKDRNLNIDEQRFIKHLQQHINSRIMRMQNADFKGKYKNSLIFSIQEPEIAIDQTIQLNKEDQEILRKQMTQQFIDFSPEYLNKIDIQLLKLQEEQDDFIFKFKFSNLSELNLIIKRIKIKIFDETKKFYINLTEPIKFKAHTSKDISVYVKKEELHDIDLHNIQVKISLI